MKLQNHFPQVVTLLSVILGIVFVGGAYKTAENMRIAGTVIAHAQVDESGQNCFWECGDHCF